MFAPWTKQPPEHTLHVDGLGKVGTDMYVLDVFTGSIVLMYARLLEYPLRARAERCPFSAILVSCRLTPRVGMPVPIAKSRPSGPPCARWAGLRVQNKTPLELVPACLWPLGATLFLARRDIRHTAGRAGCDRFAPQHPQLATTVGRRRTRCLLAGS